MLSILLLACNAPAEKTPAPAPPTVAQKPAPAVAVDVEPLGIRWNQATSTLQVEVRLAGPHLNDRKAVVYVGVTVITEQDQEIDLLVHSVFPATMTDSLFFSTHLPQTPKQVLIGAWNKKIQPCNVDRSGCKEFGFVLDESLGSFPRGLYTNHLRQRILPASVEVGFSGTKGDEHERAAAFASIFGSTLTWVPDASDRATGIYVRRADDVPFAHSLGLGTATVVPDLSTDLLVITKE